MTRIAFVRHGITLWNKAGKAQGNSDIPLDKEGRFQAEKLAESMQNQDWDIIFSSNLKRAKQTAEIIQHKLNNNKLYLDKRLREVSGGQIEGTTLEERLHKWGSNWRDLDLGMENNKYILHRGFSFLEEITQTYAGKNIIVVSHGSFIKRLLRELFPELDMETSLGNCSLTIVQKVKEEWKLELHNCIKHL